MKKLSYLLIICIAVLFASCSSCSHKEQNVDPLDVPTEFENHLTDADTAKVKEIIAIYMKHIQNGEFYDAAGSLFRLEDNGRSQRVPRLLNNEEIERMVKVYKLFPVVDYKIDYMRFRENNLNEVCVSVIMQKGQNGQPDAVSKMFFNPIYHANQWCLVLDDSHQGTRAFVPAQKRDSMRNVYKNSNAGQNDRASHALTNDDNGTTGELKAEGDR